MDFLGIGPLELVFVLVIALIVLGPRDIARFSRSAGRALNRLYRSEIWGTVNKASREFRNLPNRLAREAALEELDESLRQASDAGSGSAKRDGLEAWVPSPKSPPKPDQESAEPPADGSPADASEQEGDS